MSCNTISLSPISTPCIGQTPGGIRKVWVAKHSDVTYPTSAVTYISGTTIPESVSSMTLPSGVTFVGWETVEENTSYSSTAERNVQANSLSRTNSLSITFYGVDSTKRVQLMAAMLDYVTVVFEDGLGQLWLMGFENRVSTSANTTTIEATLAGKNGYDLTLTEVAMYDAVPLILTEQEKEDLGLI